jgi:hypothetical protein
LRSLLSFKMMRGSIGGFISSGIGATRQVATAAMDAHGNPYLAEEEATADAMAVTLLNEIEPLGCHALIALLEQRLRGSGRSGLGAVGPRASRLGGKAGD